MVGISRSQQALEHFIYVYQLYSSTTGFIAHLKGIPTKQRYCAATIFTDHHSDLSYVHLQKNLTSEGMVQYKRVFEVYTKKVMVEIRQDHDGNGRCHNNEFM